MACAEGIVRSVDSNLPAVNRGYILITEDLGKKHAPSNGIREMQGQYQSQGHC